MIPLPNAFLEAVNGALFVVLVCMIAFTLEYLVWAWREAPREAGWHCALYARLRPLIGYLTFILGDAMIRGPVWYLRMLSGDGIEPTAAQRQLAVLIVAAGAIVAAIGGMCVVRFTARAAWGRWPAVLTLAAALGFGVGLALF